MTSSPPPLVSLSAMCLEISLSPQGHSRPGQPLHSQFQTVCVHMCMHVCAWVGVWCILVCVRFCMCVYMCLSVFVFMCIHDIGSDRE